MSGKDTKPGWRLIRGEQRRGEYDVEASVIELVQSSKITIGCRYALDMAIPDATIVGSGHVIHRHSGILATPSSWRPIPRVFVATRAPSFWTTSSMESGEVGVRFREHAPLPPLPGSRQSHRELGRHHLPPAACQDRTPCAPATEDRFYKSATRAGSAMTHV